MDNFLGISADQWLLESTHFFVIRDGFPVSPGHCLIISKELRTTFFDLSSGEREDLVHTIERVRAHIEMEHSPDGYNIGMNCGTAAGQSVMHFHCHVIPRYSGDMENPKGGVRYCIPAKGMY